MPNRVFSNCRRGPCYVAAALLVSLSATTPLLAQALTRQAGLDELTRRADLIIQGRILGVRYEGHPDYPHVPTILVTLEVEQALRGSPDHIFSFRELVLFANSFGGKGPYVRGDRMLLFLPHASQYGLSSPLGGEQGRFHIVRDALGREQILNEFSNAGLFNNVLRTASRYGLAVGSSQERLASVRAGPVDFHDFVGLVKSLTSLPRLE